MLLCCAVHVLSSVHSNMIAKYFLNIHAHLCDLKMDGKVDKTLKREKKKTTRTNEREQQTNLHDGRRNDENWIKVVNNNNKNPSEMKEKRHQQ